MARRIIEDSTDVTVTAYATDAITGQPKTGIAFGDVSAGYVRTRSGRVAIAPVALASAAAAHSDGGWFEIDSADMPGYYRFDLPDAACASGADEVFVALSATGATFAPVAIELAEAAEALATLLDEELGRELPQTGTVREAIMLMRAYAGGTRRITSTTSGRFEEILLPDRSTILRTRRTEPRTGPVARVVEEGDFTVVMEGDEIGAIVFTGLDCFTSHHAEPGAAALEFAGLAPTTPVQVGAATLTFVGNNVNAYWS